MVFLGGLCLLPILFFLARSRAEARTVLALCIVPVCVGFVPPIATALYAKGSYMTFRALLNAPVYAAAAIVIFPDTFAKHSDDPLHDFPPISPVAAHVRWKKVLKAIGLPRE